MTCREVGGTKKRQQQDIDAARADWRDCKLSKCEGVDAMLSGDVETGKTILRDYIKATVGCEKLGEATGTQPKSIRMFGPRGNPQARTCLAFSVISRSGQV